MIRNLILGIASAAVLTQTAWAGPTSSTGGALQPGQPAGVHQAQLTSTNTMLFVGLGVLVVGAGIYLASGTYKTPGQSNQSSATGTSP